MHISHRSGRLIALLIGAFLSQFAPSLLVGQEAQDGGPVRPRDHGAVAGIVVDGDSGEPLAGVMIELIAAGRGDLTRPDGRFTFDEVRPGRQRLRVRRSGYAPTEREVEVVAGETSRVQVRMQPSAFELAEVVVTAGGRPQRAGEVFQPATSLSGSELNRRLSSSVAATLAGEPGVREQYNGPAASRPVIRGLSGDRVQVLEDGQPPGDVSSTAADHAVSIEPLEAERIEVVRGAAGLLYGSSALGGVVNVVRDDVPRVLPDRMGGDARLQGESVNGGLAATAALRGALGSVGWRATASGRLAGDTRTPEGVLPSTDLSGSSGSLGASWIGDSGFAGAAARFFALDYGVPGIFAGQTIPGAHEDGVQIEMRRASAQARGAWLAGVGPFEAIEADAGYTWYRHREFEGPGIVGTEFGQLTGIGRLVARHTHSGDMLRREGAVGASAAVKDFSVAGSATGSRPAHEVNLALFAYEELGRGRARLQAGARYDWTRIAPQDTRPGQLGEVRTRTFGSVAASVAGLVDVAPGVVAGISAASSFRTPSIAELFSDGPHLADYSYDIGNPELSPEQGRGVDLFVRLERPRVRGEVALFYNRINDFIYHAPTGGVDPRFGRFPVYQAAQGSARLEGAEAVLEWEALPSLVLRGQGSHVRGTQLVKGTPLPAMPPLAGTVGARIERPRWFATADWHLAARQDRVSDHEIATPGHGRADLTGGIRWTSRGRLHSLTIGIDNVTDQAWRDHLSRVRAVAPQPGRNLRLLYHVEL